MLSGNHHSAEGCLARFAFVDCFLAANNTARIHLGNVTRNSFEDVRINVVEMLPGAFSASIVLGNRDRASEK